MTEVLCKDCLYLTVSVHSAAFCTNQPRNLVTGGVILRLAESARGDEKDCGQAGKKWAPRTHKLVWWRKWGYGN